MRRNDPPVCPVCGAEVGDAASCTNCGEDLRWYAKLPLRSDWERTTQERSDDDEPLEADRFELNPVALIASLLGVALTVLGLFLPANENPGFSQLQDNSLIQHGAVVWTVVIFGVLFAIQLALAYQRRIRPTWWSLVLPISVGATTVGLLKGETLYPVVNGAPDLTAPGIHAAAGTGVYVVLAGAAIAALGIVGLRLSAGRSLRRCPECAETVLAEARVCKHCGYRLDQSAARVDARAFARSSGAERDLPDA